MHADDPSDRARILIGRAKACGKPIRVFLGFRSVRGVYVPVAFDETKNVNKSLPRSEIVVAPDAERSVVADTLIAAWAELERQRAAAVFKVTAAPRRSHAWVRGRTLG